MFLRIVTIGKGKNFAFNRSNLHVHLIQNSKLCLFFINFKIENDFFIMYFFNESKEI